MIILAAFAAAVAPLPMVAARGHSPQVKLVDCRPALLLMTFPRDRQEVNRPKTKPRPVRHCMSLASA